MSHEDELTIPQEHLVRNVASIAAEQQVTRSLRRVWYGMIGIIITVMGWGIYLSFETGIRANRHRLRVAGLLLHAVREMQ